MQTGRDAERPDVRSHAERGNERVFLRDLLQTTAPAQILAQTLTTNEIAEHVLGQQMDRIQILRPFQSLLVDR